MAEIKNWEDGFNYFKKLAQQQGIDGNSDALRKGLEEAAGDDAILSLDEAKQFFYSSEEMQELEDDFLDAFEAIAKSDGDNSSISASDLQGVEQGANGANGANGSSGSGSNGGNNGGDNAGDKGGGKDPAAPVGKVDAVSADSLKGKSSADLSSARQDEASALEAAREGRDAALAQYDADVDNAQNDYNRAAENMEAFIAQQAENAQVEDELAKNVQELGDKKDLKLGEITKNKGFISDVKSDISGYKSDLGSLVEPNKADYTTTDPETGEEIVDEAGYSAAMNAYTQKKEQLEQSIADAELELEGLEETVAGLEEERAALEQQHLDAMNQWCEANKSVIEGNQQAAQMQSALNTQHSNLQTVKATRPDTSAYDANIAQHRDNLETYGTAIEEARAAEQSQAGQNPAATSDDESDETDTTDTQNGLKPEEEECVADPIGFAFEDENGNPVDLKLISDDGDFDSVSDFLGSTTEGVSKLTDLANEDGIVTGQALADAGVKFTTVVNGQAVALTFDEIQEAYGISDIAIDVTKIDPDYQGDQEFGVTVSFAEQTDKKGNVTREASTQEVTGYSTFQTAEEIKAMEGYGDLIGDYNDTYRDDNGVLVDLPEQFRDSEYAQYIHVDENGNYYLNVDVNGTGKVSGEDDAPTAESLDTIITDLYSLDVNDPNYATTLASIKAAMKVANAAEQKNTDSKSADGDLYIYGGEGTISSNLTEDGAKLLLVDKEAALANITPDSDWYKKSEGSPHYRNWADEAAAQTDLAKTLTANQGFTRDSEGRKILDESSEEFTNLVSSLTSGVEGENGEGAKSPAEVWAEVDFSEYAPETVVKLAQAFEASPEADGRTFLDAAQFYCGYGADSEALDSITKSIMSKAGNDQAAFDMITKEIETAIQNGDEESLRTLFNAAADPDGTTKLDMKYVLEQYKANNANISLSTDLEKLNLDPTVLESYKAIIADCENAISNENQDLINRLSSTSIDGGMSSVAEKAWENLNVEEMSPAELQTLQKDYDSIHGEGAFLEKANAVFEETAFDKIMNAVDSENGNANAKTVTVDGQKQDMDSFIERLNSFTGLNNLANLSPEDVANVAAAYDAKNGEGAFEAFMESGQTEFEPSKAYQIEQKLSEATETGKVEAEAAEKTEKLESYLDQITNPQAYLKPGERPDDEYFISVIENALGEMNELSDPMSLLETLKEEQPGLVRSLNEDNRLDEYYAEMFVNMADNDATADEMIELDSRFRELTGKDKVELTLENPAEYVDTVLGLYEGATPEEIAKLNQAFNPLELIESTFEDKAVQSEKISALFSNLFGDVDAILDEYESDFADKYGQNYADYFNEEFGAPGEESFVNVLETIGDGIFINVDDAQAALLYAAGGDIDTMVDYLISDDSFLSQEAKDTYMPMIMDMFMDIIPSAENGTTINSGNIDPSSPHSSAVNSIIDKINTFDEENQRSIERGEGELTDEYIYEHIDSVLSELTAEEKVKVLAELSETETYKDYIDSYLSDEVSASMILKECTSLEEVTAFAELYNSSQRTNDSDTTNHFSYLVFQQSDNSNMVALYQAAETKDDIIALNALYGTSSILSDLSTEDANAIIEVVSSHYSNAEPTYLDGTPIDVEDHGDSFRNQYYKTALAESAFENTVEAIFDGLNNGKISTETAMWLINDFAKTNGQGASQLYSVLERNNLLDEYINLYALEE